MSEDPFEAGQKPKFPQIWKLPDAPVHEARTAATLLKHDDVELGDLLMIVCSAAVKLDVPTTASARPCPTATPS
jgi:hypothetical protein